MPSLSGKSAGQSDGSKREGRGPVFWTELEDETLQVLAQTFQFNWQAIAKSGAKRRERSVEMIHKTALHCEEL